MSYALLIMGEISLLGTPFELAQFIDPRAGQIKKKELEPFTKLLHDIYNFILTVLIVLLLVLAWPVIAIFLWGRKK